MPLHLPATGSVWAISDTANHTVTIARGLLEAATSDDINPVALLTCSAFGALIPVSPETRLKIERLARLNHTSSVLNFVKAQIGYRKDDSVEQLSRSDSGIRFLCLLATLCTLDHYDAADRLDAMFQATQKDFQIRPTIKQLQIMMTSMRTKLVMADFATSVAGFEIMLRASLDGLGAGYEIGIAQIPTKESLQELILALNHLGRIGEEGSIEAVDIRSISSYAPWTCAFVKWLLGLPPSVRTLQGRTLLHQEQAPVTITIVPRSTGSRPSKRTADGKEKLEVVAVQKLRNLRDIIFLEPVNETRFSWQGLVSPKTWVDYHFAVLFDKFSQLREEGQLRDAFGQALFFIVAKLPERLLLCDDFGSLKTGMLQCDGAIEDLFHKTAPKAFLKPDLRVQVANELVRDHVPLVREDIDKASTLLPSNVARTLSAACQQCQNPTNSIIAGQLPCQVNDLLEGIGELGAMLLTLSLFGPFSETFPMLKAGLSFETTPFHHRLYPIKQTQAIRSTVFQRLITTGWQALMHGKCSFLSCPPIAVFQHAAKLLGHQKIWDSTIISSSNGQVLFPAFFEARDFLGDGFLQLCAFPGKLQKGDMQFDFLLDSWSNKINTEGVSDAETEEVDSDAEEDAAGNDGSSIGIMQGDEDVDIEGAETGVRQAGHEDQADPSDEGEHGSDAASMSSPAAGQTDGVPAHRRMVPASLSGAQRRFNRSNEIMKWTISVRDQVLHGELRLQEDGEAMTIAWSLIESLARARLSPPCRHSYNNPAGEVADSFELALNANLRGHGWPRSLIIANQSYAEQLNALQAQDNYPPAVVHVDGCIQCALRLGLEHRVRVVIS